MNVDIDNYSQIREQIQKLRLIQNSQYISYDLQFAGLKFQNNQKDRSSFFPAEKYQKMSAVARKYSIIQIGITFFTNNNNKIHAHPYNFYVFPRTTFYSDPSVSLQSGCVSFNTSNHMDWSRWIQKGITYMKLTQYERIIQIQQKAKSYKQLFQFLQEDNQDFVMNIIQAIKRAKFKEQECILMTAAYFNVKKVLEKYFQEKQLLFAILKVENKQNQDEQLEEDFIKFKIVRISVNQKQKNDRKKQEELFGFTLLFQKIWNSGKPFIGHNSMFDILFMYEAFIAPLPYDYQLFKQSIVQVKSNISSSNNDNNSNNKMIDQKDQPNFNNPNLERTFYDTKLISSNINNITQFFQHQPTSLEGIYKLFKQNNSTNSNHLIINLPTKYQRYNLQNSILHQAGFDSYLTGWVFYQLKYYCYMNKINFDQFAGKINLNRSYFQIDLLGKSDNVCQYIRVYYIQVAKQRDFINLEYLKKNKYQTIKTLRQILKQQQIIKDVYLHQGNKQIFIQIKNKKDYHKVTQILLKYKKKNVIKNIYGLSRFINERKVKEFIENGKASNGAGN